MNQNNDRSKPISQLAATLKDEIDEVEAQEQELKAKEDMIQAEHN